MRTAATNMEDLQQGVRLELKQKITAINTLATKVAAINDTIAKVKGNGQPPNDMLDQREQLIREINQFIQTSSIEADDGSITFFPRWLTSPGHGHRHRNPGSQAWMEYGDQTKNTLTITRTGQTLP